MSKYLKLYDNESQYLIAQSQQDFTQYKPNVVYCIGENKSHYNNIQSNDDMSQDEQYIIFEDPEVRRICSINWGDYRKTVTTIDDENNTTNIQVILYHTTPQGKQSTTIQNVTRIKYDTDVAGTINEPLGITFTQAAAVSSIGNYGTIGPFRNNTVITSFMEFEYFTSAQGLTYGSSNTQWVFYGCNSLRKIKIPEGIKHLGAGGNGLRGLNNLHFVDIPSTINDLTGYSWAFGGGDYPENKSGYKTIILRAITPPPTVDDGAYGYKQFKGGLYVPDESVNAYKTAQKWSVYANYIKPLSQFYIDYPNGYQ